MVKQTAMVVVLVLSLGSPSVAIDKTLKEIYEQARKTVVLLITYDQEGKPHSLGSGVILTTTGEIVTNLHLVRTSKLIFAKMWNGSFFLIDEVEGVDEKSDLIVLKARALDLLAAKIGAVVRMGVGDPVIAIGNPIGLEGTLSNGIVSGFRKLPSLGDVIQTTAPTSPGSSGGGLFDREGRLVGITTSTMVDGQNINFAIPALRINEVQRFSAPVKFSEFQVSLRESSDKRTPAEVPTSGSRGAVERAKKFLVLEMFDDAHSELVSALGENRVDPEVHFYLGEIWLKRRNYEKAREEFKIALNLDQESLTPLIRLAAVSLALYDQEHRNEFRAEAVRYLRQVNQLRSRVKSDKYADQATLTAMIGQIDAIRTHLLGITGDWVTNTGNVWKFIEGDGPSGKQTAPNTGLLTGNISVKQVGSDSAQTFGYMWRNSELEIEGWYVLMLSSNCAYRLDVLLRESDDGMQLRGVATSAPSNRPRDDCAVLPTTLPIELHRR